MDFIKQHWFEIATGMVAFCLLAFNFVLAFRLREYKKMARLLEGSTVEEYINSLEKRYHVQQKAVQRLDDEISAVNKRISGFLQHWHLFRFNAFDKTGSDLSFSLALLNDEADGVVLTSIFGREDSRVYAKPVLGGKSKYNLSEEEIQAIKKAIKTR